MESPRVTRASPTSLGRTECTRQKPQSRRAEGRLNPATRPPSPAAPPHTRLTWNPARLTRTDGRAWAHIPADLSGTTRDTTPTRGRKALHGYPIESGPIVRAGLDLVRPVACDA
jgi:hypothetical protein